MTFYHLDYKTVYGKIPWNSLLMWYSCYRHYNISFFIYYFFFYDTVNSHLFEKINIHVARKSCIYNYHVHDFKYYLGSYSYSPKTFPLNLKYDMPAFYANYHGWNHWRNSKL